MKKINHIEQLLRYVEDNGVQGLLPQNLPDKLLDRMNKEGDAVNNNTTEKTPPSSLLIAVMLLTKGEKHLGKKVEIDVAPNLLMDNFSLYITSLRIEDMIRKGDIEIAKRSLPSIKNIFDTTRSVEIMWLR